MYASNVKCVHFKLSLEAEHIILGRILHIMVTFIDKYAKMMTEHFGDAQ
jgi:hypothetical protein